MSDRAKLMCAGRFRWQINRLMMAFAGIFLPLTIVLGFWQLGREEEKTLLLAASVSNEKLAPVALAELAPDGDYSYRRVLVSGQFDNRRTVLLQNRIRNGQPGYEVVSPFRDEASGRWLLVNRGWTASAAGNTAPEVSPVEGDLQLVGHLYSPPDEPFTLGEEQWREDWPQVLQNLEVEGLEARLGVPLYSHTLRLDAQSPAALAVGWPRVNVQPQKHRAYAIQWFAMATALVVLSIFANSNLGDVLRRLWRKKDE